MTSTPPPAIPMPTPPPAIREAMHARRAAPLPPSGALDSFAYVDDQGVHRALYYRGRPDTLSCAASTVCRILLDSGEANASSVVASSQWHINPLADTDYPTITIVPDANAPDSSVVIDAPGGHQYSILLHVDPLAQGWAYGFIYPDKIGKYILPRVTPHDVEEPSPAPSGSPDATEPVGNDPVAPEPCPAGYVISRQNAANHQVPPFWPEQVLMGQSTVALQFPADGIVPLVGVPTSDTPSGQVWLDHLAIVAQAGEIVGTKRIVRVLACYRTIVFYTGFGKGRSAVILNADNAPKTVLMTPSSPAPSSESTP